MNVARRAAAALLHYTVLTLPVARRDWGAAMLAELDQIPSTIGAVRWSLSAMRGAARIRREAVTQTTGVSLAARRLFTVACAAPTALVLAWIGHQWAGLQQAGMDHAPAFGLGALLGSTWLLPAALGIAVGGAWRCAVWRRRAGLRATRLASRLLGAAEVTVIGLTGALWASVYVYSGGWPMTELGVLGSIFITAYTTVMLFLPWFALLTLLDMCRRWSRPEPR